MAKAATSEENVTSQVADKRLKAQIREALLSNDPTANVSITPYAYMGHAFLVGYVSGAEQRNAVTDLARGVDGVRTLDAYLPDKPSSSGTSSKASDLEIKGKVKAAITADPSVVTTRVEIESLDGHVVLLGVLSSQDAIDTALASTRQVGGVTGVTNFLLLPESEYERRRPSLR
jgi:hyperosmotically inducible periplasmic protein